MKNTGKLALCVTAIGATAGGSARADEMGWYYRSTLGTSEGGGSQAAFSLPGAQAKYRLGNEPETYGELWGAKDLFTTNGGVKFSAVGRLALNANVRRVSTFSPSSATSFAEAYVKAEDLPHLQGARLWAGRRFYRRNDVHMLDYYYWNPSGDGLGLEDVPVGKLRLSYAYFRDEPGALSGTARRHDFQLSGIETNPRGTVELGAYLVQARSGSGGNNGWALTLQHKQQGVLGGTNKFAVQYGEGPGMGLGQTGDVSLTHDSHRLRFVNALDWQAKDRWSGQVATVYQRDHLPGGNQNWLSYGVRPVYALSDHFKLAVELGQDQVRAAGGTRRLTKITIAPTLSGGKGFSDRPDLRFFMTYARWNSAAQSAAAPGSALSPTGQFGANRSGFTFGVQLEDW